MRRMTSSHLIFGPTVSAGCNRVGSVTMFELILVSVSWPMVSHGGSGGDIARVEFSACAETRCALSSHFRNRIRSRLFPYCSGFLPAGGGPPRPGDVRQTDRK